MQNYLNHMDTYGEIKITAFLPNKNPISDSFTINICTSWIEDVELINNNEQDNTPEFH